MATLQDAISQAQLYARTLAGIKGAPAYAPEQMSDFPFCVAYSGGGTWEFGAGQQKKGLHTIVLELHVARKNLPGDIAAAMAYSDSIPALLMSKLLTDNKWNGTVDTFGSIRYTFGPMGWNGAKTIGFRFFIEGIKMQSEL